MTLEERAAQIQEESNAAGSEHRARAQSALLSAHQDAVNEVVKRLQSTSDSHARRIREVEDATTGDRHASSQGYHAVDVPRSDVVRGSGFPWSTLALGYALSGTTCTIYAGTLRLHGIGTYAVAQADVSLSGETEWVYLYHNRDHGSTGISHSATEPASTTDQLRIPLYRFTQNAGGWFTLSRVCNMGDVNIDAPVV
jgi:hypothetical protein